MAENRAEVKGRLTDSLILAFVVVVMILLGAGLVGNVLDLLDRSHGPVSTHVEN
jgi:hypothetical protein